MDFSKIPTPETDARSYRRADAWDMASSHWVPADHARDLERRLTVALRETAQHRESFSGHVYVKNDEYADLCEDRRRLAVARDTMRTIQEFCNSHNIDPVDCRKLARAICTKALTQTAPKP